MSGPTLSKSVAEAGLQISRENAFWPNASGKGAGVTFGFRASTPSYEEYYLSNDGSYQPKGIQTTFTFFDENLRNLTYLALNLWSAVAGINFIEGSDPLSSDVSVKPMPSLTNNATILLGMYSNSNDGSSGFAYLPKNHATDPKSPEGDVWINAADSYGSDYYSVGAYGFYTLIHEIGHALGLSHPSKYDAGPGQVITYESNATYIEDSRQYTVMSYFSETYTGAYYDGASAQTPLMHDIAAMQHLYGAREVRIGDDIYGFNSSFTDDQLKSIYDFSQNDKPVICIYDSGGTDTIDLSGSFTQNIIDLHDGSFSSIMGLKDNISIYVGSIIENVVGGKSSDLIFGNDVANVLDGGDGDDVIYGNAGTDVIKGGMGSDMLFGGAGHDYYYIDDNLTGSEDVIVELSSEEEDTVYSSISYNLAANVEVLYLSGSAVVGGGNDLENYIFGNSSKNELNGMGGNDQILGYDGDDTLNGGDGSDELSGGLGDDTYYVDQIGDFVHDWYLVNGFFFTGAGVDLVFSSVGYFSIENFYDIEDVQIINNGYEARGNFLDNRMTGSALSNLLDGADGNDYLDGGAGQDIFIGGVDDDIFIVDNFGDAIYEYYEEGIDSVYSSVGFTLAKNVEKLLLTGAADIDGEGNDEANTLQGNTGTNILNGKGGADLMFGGRGNDTLVVDSGGDRVFEAVGEGEDTVSTAISYRLAVGQEIEALRASNAEGTSKLTLIGNEFSQTIAGNAGANTLDGGAGADVLSGFNGNDTYRIDNGGDRVVEAVGGGLDTVLTTISYKLGDGQEIEVLQAADAAGTGKMTLIGNTFAQTITGNAGANTLDGGAGADALVGLKGNDTYVVDNGGDRVFETAGGGTDTVLTSISYALATGQEIEVLQTLAPTGIAKLTLFGNEFAQKVIGNNGANILDGKLGNDTLTGGLGADTFLFSTALGASNIDHIADFAPEDTIRLSKSVFTALAVDQLAESAFKDIGMARIDADDRILYDSRNGNLFYDADGSGKGVAAMAFAVLDNKAAITHADFFIA